MIATKDTLVWVAHPEVRSTPNLHVLTRNGYEVGMVQKPNDTHGDKNAWRAYRGIGHLTTFLGHRWTRESAQALVEASV